MGSRFVQYINMSAFNTEIDSHPDKRDLSTTPTRFCFKDVNNVIFFLVFPVFPFIFLHINQKHPSLNPPSESVQCPCFHEQDGSNEHHRPGEDNTSDGNRKHGEWNTSRDEQRNRQRL